MVGRWVGWSVALALSLGCRGGAGDGGNPGPRGSDGPDGGAAIGDTDASTEELRDLADHFLGEWRTEASLDQIYRQSCDGGSVSITRDGDQLTVSERNFFCGSSLYSFSQIVATIEADGSLMAGGKKIGGLGGFNEAYRLSMSTSCTSAFIEIDRDGASGSLTNVNCAGQSVFSALSLTSSPFDDFDQDAIPDASDVCRFTDATTCEPLPMPDLFPSFTTQPPGKSYPKLVLDPQPQVTVFDAAGNVVPLVSFDRLPVTLEVTDPTCSTVVGTLLNPNSSSKKFLTTDLGVATAVGTAVYTGTFDSPGTVALRATVGDGVGCSEPIELGQVDVKMTQQPVSSVSANDYVSPKPGYAVIGEGGEPLSLIGGFGLNMDITDPTCTDVSGQFLLSNGVYYDSHYASLSDGITSMNEFRISPDGGAPATVAIRATASFGATLCSDPIAVVP